MTQEPATSEPDESTAALPMGAATHHRRWGVALVAASAVLVLAGSVGTLESSNLVWIERLLDHAITFGVIAACLFGFGVSLLVSRQWQRFAVVAACAVVALVWAVFGYVVSSVGDQEEVVTIDAPSGFGPDYEVVVRLGGFIDPAWFVSIRQTGSPFAREWQVGCISGDDPRNSFEQLTWGDRDHLIVRTSSRTVTARVDPSTGEPQRVSGKPWNTC